MSPARNNPRKTAPAAAADPSFTERLAGPDTLFSAWLGLPDPTVAALLAGEAFDAVALDMQHGAIDFAGALAAIPRIAAAGKPCLVRIAVGDFATAARLIDAGASAIVAPMINAVEDARRLVAFTKFPPVGERSWGPYGALPLSRLDASAYLAQANRLSLTLPMIETREALAALDDILTVEGVDGVFVGPSDLSIALSAGARLDPLHADVNSALAHVVARARAAGKVACAYAVSAERAADLAGRGFALVAMMSDTAFLLAGARQALQTARGA